MKQFLIVLSISTFFTTPLDAETNLGTINSIANGFGTVEECKQTPSDVTKCRELPDDDNLLKILNLATTNQCIANHEDYQRTGKEIPNCPQEKDAIRGLDHTYPSGAIFAVYNGKNSGFLNDMIKNYFVNNEEGKFNLVLPRNLHSKLTQDQSLMTLLNNPRVNIISVATMPAVDRWMQDSFEFGTLDGKPALYQLQHEREKDLAYEERLACQIAKSCDVPYFIPPDMIDPFNKQGSNLDMGGNLETLPGGTFYRGTVQSPGFNMHEPPTATIPWSSEYQKVQRKALEEAGNRLIDLDTSFLNVGHVDEIINIVKTNKPAPCNFAVMLASPKKAFELMEKEAQNLSPESNNNRRQGFIFINLIISEAMAGATPLSGGKTTTQTNEMRSENAPVNRCADVNYQNLNLRYSQRPISDAEVNDIYSRNCIDNSSLEAFVRSNEYEILKKINLEEEFERPSIQKIMDQNKEKIIAELARTTSCSNPPIIDVPVFFRNGLSYAPDLVNSVVHTPPNGASTIIMPRTYFKPFDQYMEDTLESFGVTPTFAHDMGYHLLQGQVHCGTNTARICK